MTNRPEPDAAGGSQATRSDLLSHLLTFVRLRGELVYSAELKGAWQARVEPGPSHLLFVEGGSLWLTLAEHAPMRVDAGDLVLLPRGLGHSIADTPNSTAAPIDLLGPASFDVDRLVVRHGAEGTETRLIGGVFNYEASPLPPMVQMLPAVIHIPTNGGMVPDWLELMAHFLMVEAREPRPGSALMISRTIDLLVIRTLRSWAGLRPKEVGWLTDLADARIGRALQAIHAEPDQPWTLVSLCAVAGMSRSSFVERFSAALGEAPMRYLLRWRMAIADQLLRSGAINVGETGRRIGYGSEAGFSRAFKAHFGHAPKTVVPFTSKDS